MTKFSNIKLSNRLSMKKYFKAVLGVFWITTLISCTSCTQFDKNKWEFTSPDGNIIIELTQDNTSGQLFYSSKFKRDIEKTIEKSKLGFTIGEEQYFSSLEVIEVSDGAQGIEEYKLLTGKINFVADDFIEYEVDIQNSNENRFSIIFKVFNNGFGFRYEVDNLNTTAPQLTNEMTSFRIPSSGKAWLQPYDEITKWTPGYEKPYTNGSKVGIKGEEKFNGWCFPMLFELKKSWLLVSEAGLTTNNCAMHTEVVDKIGEYGIAFPVKEEAYDLFPSEPTLTFPWKSSWRTIIMTKTLNELFKSNLVSSLSDSRIKDNFDWVKSGMASWSWWSDNDSPTNFSKVKKFIDFSFEMGWQYSLIDANWDKMKGGTIEELTSYANRRNIGLLLWYNSGGPHNTVEEGPRDLMLERAIRKKEFERISSIGIKGVKVDFFQTDKQPIIKQYIELLEDAAEFGLIVNFHGCTMPRGWQRTYPNLVTMEAVRGAESYKFGESYPNEAVLLNTIYPFTRNVVGSMDYTPVVLSESTYQHLTSFAHEIATTIVFESGVTHIAESYKILKKQPDYVLNFLKELPTSWEESELLYGYPGVELAIARKNGSKWFVGGLNSLNSQTQVELDLSFLGEGSFSASIIADGKNNRSFKHSKELVSSDDIIEIVLLPYGGYSIEFSLIE